MGFFSLSLSSSVSLSLSYIFSLFFFFLTNKPTTTMLFAKSLRYLAGSCLLAVPASAMYVPDSFWKYNDNSATSETAEVHEPVPVPVRETAEVPPVHVHVHGGSDAPALAAQDDGSSDARPDQRHFRDHIGVLETVHESDEPSSTSSETTVAKSAPTQDNEPECLGRFRSKKRRQARRGCDQCSQKPIALGDKFFIHGFHPHGLTSKWYNDEVEVIFVNSGIPVTLGVKLQDNSTLDVKESDLHCRIGYSGKLHCSLKHKVMKDPRDQCSQKPIALGDKFFIYVPRDGLTFKRYNEEVEVIFVNSGDPVTLRVKLQDNSTLDVKEFDLHCRKGHSGKPHCSQKHKVM